MGGLVQPPPAARAHRQRTAGRSRSALLRSEGGACPSRVIQAKMPPRNPARFRICPMTDAAKLPLMLAELRMPTIGRLWQDVGERADREGWGAAHFLAALCEHELAERATRRIARHLAEAGLPPGKTLETFDFAAAPSIRKAHIAALTQGDAWIEQGAIS